MSCWSVNAFDFALEKLHSSWSALFFFPRKIERINRPTRHVFLHSMKVITQLQVHTFWIKREKEGCGSPQNLLRMSLSCKPLLSECNMWMVMLSYFKWGSDQSFCKKDLELKPYFRVLFDVDIEISFTHTGDLLYDTTCFLISCKVIQNDTQLFSGVIFAASKHLLGVRLWYLQSTINRDIVIFL